MSNEVIKLSENILGTAFKVKVWEKLDHFLEKVRVINFFCREGWNIFCAFTETEYIIEIRKACVALGLRLLQNVANGFCFNETLHEDLINGKKFLLKCIFKVILRSH